MDRANIMKNIKQNLKSLRKMHGLSQKDAATIFKTSISAYQKYELEGSMVPSLHVLIRIADYYNTTLDDLVGRQIPKKENDSSITESLIQNLQKISPESKAEINDTISETFRNWINHDKENKKTMETKNCKNVYVNFENKSPHSNFMNGIYDKQESHLFIEIPPETGKMPLYVAAGDYNIGWTDRYGDHHIEHIIAGSKYFFPKEIITNKPKF